MKYSQYYGNEILVMENGINFKDSNLLCQEGNRVKRFCNNKTCQSDAFCCSEQTCIHCESHHQNCHFKSLKQITQIVTNRFNIQLLVLSKALKIEESFLKQMLCQSRKKLIQKNSFWRLEDSELDLINRIYFNQNKQIKSRNLKASMTKLQEQIDPVKLHEYLNQNLAQAFQHCQEEKQIIIKALSKIRQKLLEDPLLKRIPAKPLPKLESIMKEEIKLRNYPENQSKILLNDKNGLNKFKYLMKQLNFPSQLKLLFRASQHNFKATKFHQFCDGLDHTVTIMKTEFGKKIAGYTPVKWSSQNSYLGDESQRSFLLQLDCKQRMSLCKPDYAIYNNPMYGPVFGFFDIFISQNCHENQQSYTNFPYSYNKNNKYKNCQQSYFTLCGPSLSRYFRVIEYQVFQVFK